MINTELQETERKGKTETCCSVVLWKEKWGDLKG